MSYNIKNGSKTLQYRSVNTAIAKGIFLVNKCVLYGNKYEK